MSAFEPVKRLSAQVSIELRTASAIYSVVQVAHDRLIFALPTLLTESSGELILSVDGQEYRWSVQLELDTVPQRVVAIRSLIHQASGTVPTVATLE